MEARLFEARELKLHDCSPRSDVFYRGLEQFRTITCGEDQYVRTIHLKKQCKVVGVRLVRCSEELYFSNDRLEMGGYIGCVERPDPVYRGNQKVYTAVCGNGSEVYREGTKKVPCVFKDDTRSEIECYGDGVYRKINKVTHP